MLFKYFFLFVVKVIVGFMLNKVGLFLGKFYGMILFEMLVVVVFVGFRILYFLYSVVFVFLM